MDELVERLRDGDDLTSRMEAADLIIALQSHVKALEEEVRRKTAQLEDKVAWLIEFKPSVSRIPVWMGPEFEAVDDVNEAIQFCRKEDADKVIEYIGWTEAFAIEHMWPALQTIRSETDNE